MPNIIFLVGVPGTGKSTWTTKFIQENPDYVIASSDNIIDEFARNDGISYSEAFKKYIAEADYKFMFLLKDAISKNKNIIVDRTNVFKNGRRKILSLLPKTYTKSAYVFSLGLTHGFDELNRRLKTREQELNKHIPDFVVSNMREKYDPPSENEGFDTITNVN